MQFRLETLFAFSSQHQSLLHSPYIWNTLNRVIMYSTTSVCTLCLPLSPSASFSDHHLAPFTSFHKPSNYNLQNGLFLFPRSLQPFQAVSSSLLLRFYWDGLASNFPRIYDYSSRFNLVHLMWRRDALSVRICAWSFWRGKMYSRWQRAKRYRRVVLC